MNNIAEYINEIKNSNNYKNKIKILDLQNDKGVEIFSNIKNLKKNSNLYYVFDINEQSGSGSGYAKAILISDEEKINVKGTKSKTGHCFTGHDLFRINIKNKKYCINPNNTTTIIKIKQSGFKIGDIIYKKKNNTNNFIKFEAYNNLKTNNAINRSFIHLYNYEVQYMQPFINNMHITSDGYTSDKNKMYNQKSIMYPILNNETNNNNNYIKTKHNFQSNDDFKLNLQKLNLQKLNLQKLNLQNKYLNSSKNYRNKIIRKKVFFSKEIIKVGYPIKKINGYVSNNGITNNESTSPNENNYFKIPKILTYLTNENDKDIIIILYDIYLNYASRTNMTKINKNKNKNFKNYYQKLHNNFDSLLIENTEILKEYFNNKKIIDNKDFKEDKKKNDLPIIYNMKTNKNVILIGDIHGSFHSFFRIFLRLLKQNIINNDLTLNNYKLIFLGDVFDRGQFAYECLILIFILMKVNNSADELNVILNRGNHEDIDTAYQYGFYNELIHKYYYNKKQYQNNNQQIYINLFDFIQKYLSWAIILTHNDTKYWLCHGGFPFAYNEDKQKKIIKLILQPINFRVYDNYDILKLKNHNSHISWNDFHNQPNTIINKDRGATNKSILLIGTEDLKKFLKMNKIDFIIRGHQDNNCNDHLLIKCNNNYFNGILPLTFLISYQLIKEYKRLSTCRYHTPPEQNNSNNPLKKSNGSFMTINPKSNKFNEENDNLTLYPVLTISTNSDKDRILFHDSFIVLKSKANET